MLNITMSKLEKKIISLVGFVISFVTVFGGFYLFVESADQFGLIPKEYQDITFFVGMFILSLALAGLHNFVVSSQQKREFLQKKISEIENNLSLLTKTSKSIMNGGNYYKLIYLSWILENEFDKSRMKDIDGSHSKMYSITAQKPLQYIISIINGIMSRLSADDSFLTVSNIGFWSHITEDTGFLEANVSAVKANGVTIDRIVLVDKKVLLQRNTEAAKNDLRNIIATLNDFYIKHKEAFNEKLIWQFYISDSYATDNVRPVPYAIIVNSKLPDKDCMFMHPVTTTKDDATPTQGDPLLMNLRFGTGMHEINIWPQFVKFNHFKKETSHLLSIDQMYSKLFEKKGEWNIS